MIIIAKTFLVAGFSKLSRDLFSFTPKGRDFFGDIEIVLILLPAEWMPDEQLSGGCLNIHSYCTSRSRRKFILNADRVSYRHPK